MNTSSFSALLIDDCWITRDVFRLVFDYYGLSLTAVVDAESAFNYLERHTPDVIVVDLYLDGTDGWAILRYLREMGFAGPVVATTYYHTSRVWGQALIAGFDGYLPKPLDVQSLVPSLRELWVASTKVDVA